MTGRDSKQMMAAMAALGDSVDPLARLDAARRVREAGERIEGVAVEQARKAGRTWKEIGEVYGLTKQGAQQRFQRDGTETSEAPRSTRSKRSK